MITPITEEYFNKVVGNDTLFPWTFIKNFKLKEIGSGQQYNDKESNFRWGCIDGLIYLEKLGGGVFIYSSSYSLVIVPHKFSDLTIDEDEEFDYSDWKYRDSTSAIGRNYTHNELHRIYDWYFLNQCKDRINDIPSGHIEIYNDRIGYSKKTYINVEHDWCDRIVVGIPELLEIPANRSIVEKECRFIKNAILWTQKK